MVPFLSWHRLASECVLLADFPAQRAPYIERTSNESLQTMNIKIQIQ